MATFQVQPEIKLTPIQNPEQADYLSLTMAALRLVNPWSEKWTEPQVEEQPKGPIISLAEVSAHDTPKDCWVVIYDRVYDITDFLYEHPGGADIMLEYAGSDASLAFRGSGHSKMATKALDQYYIGELPIHERLYRKNGGIRLSEMPD